MVLGEYSFYWMKEKEKIQFYQELLFVYLNANKEK